MQPSTFISTLPNGAPCGSAITSTGAGAARCSSRSASRMTSRLRPTAMKLAGRGAPSRRVDLAQRRSERIGIVGLDRGGAARAEAEACEDRLGQRERPRQARDVVARFCAQQEPHRRGAIGECRGDGFEADLRDLVDRERQDIAPAIRRRSAPAHRSAACRGRRRAAARSAWRAASLAIAREQRAQLAHQRVRRRQRVRGRAGRADRGALPATRADMRVDGDMIAGGRDRAGRAEIEAARAADDASSANGRRDPR